MAVPASAAGLSADLRKRIEIMAEHIARNGPDFENTVRQKNVSNPQFAFLYNGEGAEYYAQVLAAHRGQPLPAMGGPGGGSGSIVDYASLLQRWKEPPLYPLASDIERQLHEVLASLEAMASRDAIRNGRAWVECNSAMGAQIASNITKRLPFLRSCAHRLHILYLVHDVLQTEAARKDSPRHLIRAFRPYLPWMLRPSYQMALAASPTGDDGARVLRLLELWVERNILEPPEVEEMKALITPKDLPGVPAGPRPSVAPPQHRGGVPGGMPTAMGTAYPVAQHPGLMAAPGMMGGGQVLPVPPNVPPSRLQGYRPLMPNLQGKQTPETVPVGVLATMMMHAVRRVGRQNFVSYRPLDTSMTPQMLPPMEVPSQRLLERVEDFYQDLRDEERDSSSSRSRSSSRSSRSSSRSRSRSAGREVVAARGTGSGGFSGGGGSGGGFSGGVGAMSSVPPPAIF